MTATVLDKSTYSEVTLSSTSTIQAQSMGALFDLPATKSGHVAFAQFKVNAAPYALPSGKWTRAPHFVILRRPPELLEDQGYWVGAATGLFDHEAGVYIYRRTP